MASIHQEIFPKFKNTIKLSTRQDGDGNEIEVEVREDEDQSLKLQEIIDILVAAGYFRARIKGLSAFDKVVGGITWCVESCNIDVDVDLLFQENLTIGQKIALTEKIVSVLQKMKCPHRIEPHQIQGLDFIHIFPVIQWLVKTSMEFRHEMSAFVKSYAVNQFNKHYSLSSNDHKIYDRIHNNIKTVQEIYRPKRYYRRKNSPPDDKEARIQITVLEYGRIGSTTVPSRSSDLSQEVMEDRKAEELHIEQLMQGLAFTNTEDSIDTEILNSEEKDQLFKHYESLQAEIKDGGIMSQNEKKLLQLQQQKNICEQQHKKLMEDKERLDKEIEETTESLNEITTKHTNVNKALQELKTKEEVDPETLKKVEELVVIHESLRDQEQKFREHCKSELAKLHTLIENAQTEKVPEKSKNKIIQQLEEEKERLKEYRLQIAKKSRAIAGLERQLDEVPTRAELAQYQRRFLELYNQVSTKHKETKQYYTLYNTLDDTRLYIKKELTLLNSILDNYPEAMQSSASKEEFLEQFEMIVENVKQTKEKLQNKYSEERMIRDQLSQKLLGLMEQQRRYVAAVRQLDIECRRNEELVNQRHGPMTNQMFSKCNINFT